MTPRAVAVFGSSEPRPGDALWLLAEQAGARLADAGFRVLTGGYGGVMEAASAGARRAGGRTIGVTCAIFRDRRPNPFLDEIVEAPDLYQRSRELIERASGYVVLSGRAGTLAELALLWALERAGCLPGRRVVLLGRSWDAVVDTLRRQQTLEPSQLHMMRFADDADRLIEALELAPGPGSGRP